MRVRDIFFMVIEQINTVSSYKIDVWRRNIIGIAGIPPGTTPASSPGDPAQRPVLLIVIPLAGYV